jgi:hypothetical protein
MEKRRIARKIRELSKPHIINNIPETPLPTVECLRCGYIWTPYSLDVTPRLCSRCGSLEWMLPPTETSRKPSDPPSPYWRVRKGTRKPKQGDVDTRYRFKIYDKPVRPKRPVGRPRATPPTIAPATPVTPTIPALAPPLPPAPWERDLLFTPPTVIPPPPAPSPTISLSERFAQLRSDNYEPQPERATSHEPASPLPPEPAPTVMDEINRVTREEITDNPAAMKVIADYVFGSEEVPPESIGIPATPAEREELEKASAEAWPTTRNDD